MKILISIATFIAFASLSLPSIAGKTYTPTEIEFMISNGRYPLYDRDNPEKHVEPMPSFNACKAAIKDKISLMGGLGMVVVETQVDTGLLYMTKVWARDGVLLLACPEPDKTMVVAMMPYLDLDP